MKEITYRFEKAEDYKLVPVNNIYGSVTNTGEIFCDLVFESTEIPEEIVYTKTKEGVLEEISRDLKGSKEKIILINSFIGISITKDTAKNIAYWLLKKVDELEDNE
ncbi:hypothetical protein BmHG_00085 [Borrelia miyamotoi]|uniref:Uncharacterized protein n=1 Tax=Borrelia miyamotoi TaxID=47466 RepID=A0AAP9CG44_9SPIR|nr:hypothetical protein [Borrelia miyamotoi]AGT27086.1 hypothetical protein I871_00420 [Borrelia miyamotoi LB-2001]AHH05335.1 Hypothetical protein BOM_0792 [Borrelia miyamotoi FR64b]AJA58292.1 hypothetical protein RJ61_00395 [Borrelia miyamotoi]AOW95369.1 hypothetical protein AXH25_00405 [Borrelia miyamotoi]ATQ15096.1 hypothetical protein CNO14_03850 [Borrelia miyamotoi]